MFFWLYRQIQSVRHALADRQHPEQLAWAMAIGVWIGLVPKGNLVALCLVTLALCLRINHAMAAVTAVAVSFAGFVLDPFTHGMGQWVLQLPALQSFYTWAWQQPLVPWTDLNNTVVMGSLLLGLMTLFPTYSFSLPLFKSLARRSEDQPPKRPEVMAVDVRRITPSEVISKSETEEPCDDRLVASTSDDEGPRAEIDVIRIRRPGRKAVRVPGEHDRADNGNVSDNEEKAA